MNPGWSAAPIRPQVGRDLNRRQSHFRNFVHEVTSDPDFHPRLKRIATDAALLYAGPKILRKVNQPEVRKVLALGAKRVLRPFKTGKKLARAANLTKLRDARIAAGQFVHRFGSVKIIRTAAVNKKRVYTP